MRDRLIELIVAAPTIELPFGSRAQGKIIRTAQTIADYLLANGVIVPPCKVGDVVYSLAYRRGGFTLLKGKAERFAFNRNNRLCIDICFENGFVWRYHPEDFGKTLFISQEKAEKVLAERSKNDK